MKDLREPSLLDATHRAEEAPELRANEPVPAVLRRQLLCRLLPILTLGFGISFIDRSNIAFAETSEEFRDEVGVTTAIFGLASGIFFAGYGTMQVPVVHLISLVGARRVLAATLFIWGVIASSLGAVGGPVLLCVLRFCLGLAEAGYYPGALFFLSTWLPDELSGTASAMLTCLGVPLSVVGALSAGAILTVPVFDGLLGLAAWRWLFLLQGVPAVLTSAALLAQLPETPASARWLSDEHRALLLAKLAAAGSQVPSSQPRPSLLTRVLVARAESSAAASAPRPDAAAVGPRAADAADRPLSPSSVSSLSTSAAAAGAPAPLSLVEALRRVLPRGRTYIFAVQHFNAALLVYTYMFFAPLMLKELLPGQTIFAVSALQVIARHARACAPCMCHVHPLMGNLSCLWHVRSRRCSRCRRWRRSRSPSASPR